MTTTGLGSWPGRDIDEAVRQTLDLFSDLPYLPELPARGPGSDMIGRSLGLIEAIPFELSVTGWRLAPGSGHDQRRAHARLRDDVDVLAEAAEGYTGPLTVSVAGPWTLAAAVDLGRGGAVVGDPGARRDLGQAWVDAAGELVRRTSGLIPGAAVMLKVDEPMLPMVLGGGVRTESGLHRHRSVGIEEVASAYEGLTIPRAVHCCAPDTPIRLLREAGFETVAVDGGTLTRRDWDAVAEHADEGGTVWLGVVPTGSGRVPTADDVIRRTLGWLRPLELGPSWLDRLVLTPACGLATYSVAGAIAVARALAAADPQVRERLSA